LVSSLQSWGLGEASPYSPSIVSFRT
jgi:hypothetical protein